MTKQSVPQRMHEQMHQLPGVPEHDEAERLNHRGGLPNRRLQDRSPQSRPLKVAQINHPRPMNRPRMLVRWQNTIGRLFTRRDT
jgi:hypothetical protein